jgi:hypothetical protein
MAHVSPFQMLLAFQPIDRTRRNHGLEHATITLLSQKHRGLSMVGRSTPNGFYLYGEVPTEAVEQAAQEALRRLKAGEHHLAVHPNCGTNYVTAGVTATAASYFGFLGAKDWRERIGRLPLVAALMTLALIFAQPLGLVIQRDVTTSPEMRDMEIVSIKRKQQGKMTVHTVTTRG